MTQRQASNGLLTLAETAKRLDVTDRTLRRWRAAGTGPPFTVLSSRCVVYRAEDIAAFRRRRARDQPFAPRSKT